MIYGLYNSAAGMMVNQYRQGVLANNIANAETAGFKRDIAVFAERIPARLAGRRQGPSDPTVNGLSGGLWLGRTHTDFSEATKLQTGHELDLAIDGPGFFSVQDDGQTLYTRDGRMMMNVDGLLVSVTDGAPLLGRGGVPVMLNRQGSQPHVDQDGRVFQDGRLAGQLQLVDFDDYSTLSKVDSTRFAAPEDAAYAAPLRLRKGFAEGSGVKPLTELVSMIEASRAYQLNAQMVTLQDQSIGRLISSTLRV